MILTRSRISMSIALAFVIFLAACDSGSSEPEQDLPTAIVIPTEQSESQAIDEDPTPTQELPTATREPGVRPTLPPTWTPEPSNTPIPPTETPTPDPNEISVDSQSVEVPTIPRGCVGFGPDTIESQEEIILGETARIAWRDVIGAGAYWVLVYDASNDNIDPENLPVVFEDYITNTAYTIPADVFRAPVRYGWEVRPLDGLGIQMCQGRGGLILVRN